MDPASSSISHLANLCQWSLKWRVPFLEAGCLPILHSLLTESSIMTPIATKCAIWTDWQIITQPKQCFKPQPGISWATAAASCRQVAATKKTRCVCVCATLCEGGWGGLGLRGFHKHFERFSDRSSILFPQSTTASCVLKSAVLLLTASDSLFLKTHGCCWYSMPSLHSKQNFTLFFFCRHWLFSSETFSLKQQQKKNPFSCSHTFKYWNCLYNFLLREVRVEPNIQSHDKKKMI